MRILFIADVVGRPGREALKAIVPLMRQASGIDVVVANGENSAKGLGITPKLADEILGAGVDVITTGNHVFRRSEIVARLAVEPRLLRPANLRSRAPGRGVGVYDVATGSGTLRIGVMNAVGQTYMDPADDPVAAVEAMLAGPLAEVRIRLLDFHAEATAEKRAMFHWLNGRVTAVLGTHTHVQTADEQVSDRGTAYITDAGMTGPTGSVIGMDAAPIIKSIETGLPQRYTTGRTGVELQGALIDVDAVTGRATSIERVRRRFEGDIGPEE